MSGKAEEMIQLLQSNPSMWALGGDMPIFRDGLADMLARIQALEAWQKAMSTPATPPPATPGT